MLRKKFTLIFKKKYFETYSCVCLSMLYFRPESAKPGKRQCVEEEENKRSKRHKKVSYKFYFLNVLQTQFN